MKRSLGNHHFLEIAALSPQQLKLLLDTTHRDETQASVQ